MVRLIHSVSANPCPHHLVNTIVWILLISLNRPGNMVKYLLCGGALSVAIGSAYPEMLQFSWQSWVKSWYWGKLRSECPNWLPELNISF